MTAGRPRSLLSGHRDVGVHVQVGVSPRGLAAARGVTEDAIALAQPWASVVLSGAVTRAQLAENLATLTVGQLPELGLAEAPGAYWAERAAGPWH